MRILLDECLPKRLKRDLVGHDVRTVPDMGWASRQNGDLLDMAQHEFDVFLTVDRNLSLQQDVSKFSIAVVVLTAMATDTPIFSRSLPMSWRSLAPYCRGRLSEWEPDRAEMRCT